jgi:hypothetical protein
VRVRLDDIGARHDLKSQTKCDNHSQERKENAQDFDFSCHGWRDDDGK